MLLGQVEAAYWKGPKDIQALIRQMARENPTWREEHIANELQLKLGIRVSPRTVGKYLVQGPRRMPDPGQRWLTFLCPHAQAMVACDFFVVVTARFRILYVFVFMELWRRRILHVNVTDHPSADWTQKGPAGHSPQTRLSGGTTCLALSDSLLQPRCPIDHHGQWR